MAETRPVLAPGPPGHPWGPCASRPWDKNTPAGTRPRCANRAAEPAGGACLGWHLRPRLATHPAAGTSGVWGKAQQLLVRTRPGGAERLPGASCVSHLGPPSCPDWPGASLRKTPSSGVGANRAVSSPQASGASWATAGHRPVGASRLGADGGQLPGTDGDRPAPGSVCRRDESSPGRGSSSRPAVGSAEPCVAELALLCVRCAPGAVAAPLNSVGCHLDSEP